jgi:hypothetical protein
MQKQDIRQPVRHSALWPRLRQSLIYLPGALVLLYGLWLALIA